MRLLIRAWLLAVSCVVLWAKPGARGQILRGSHTSSSTSNIYTGSDSVSESSAHDLDMMSIARNGRALSGLSHMAAHGKDPHKSKSTEGSKAPPPLSSGGEGGDRVVEFEEAFELLKKYYDENKHSIVPQAVVVTLKDGAPFKLGKWVQRQRQLYKNTYVTPGQRKDFGQMTDGQKAMLATLQFKFDPTPLPAPVDWNIPFQALVEFKNKHGHTNVPEKTPYGEAGTDLGKWAQRQRQLHKNTFITPGERKGFGKLSEDRKAKLDSIGFNYKE